MKNNKIQVHDFWNEASCGEDLFLKGDDANTQFNNQKQNRYKLEPYIISFADFENSSGKKILEIGVGLGADHEMFARNNVDLYGIDLTEKAIEHTINRFKVFGLKSKISIGDAEKLDFNDCYFDVVYSWGVIHHSPNTELAIKEIFRVLKKGGEAKIMIYHKHSIVGYMLWVRYALLKFKPFTSLDTIYDKYLESPGTKAYTKEEAMSLLSSFKDVKINIELSHGDLMSEFAGQRHKGIFLSLARKIWPRKAIRKFFSSKGLFMLILAKKGE